MTPSTHSHSVLFYIFPSRWQGSRHALLFFSPLNASHCVCLHQKQLAAHKHRPNSPERRRRAARSSVTFYYYSTVAATCHTLRAETCTLSPPPERRVNLRGRQKITEKKKKERIG